MKKYKVIKEFPGLKVGDILAEETEANFYINVKEEADISEDFESIFINSVALSKDIVENEPEYFELIVENKRANEIDNLLNDMGKVAALFEADKVTAINEYHINIIDQVLDNINQDMQLISSFIK